ncbi:hypothetical protein CEXT_76481 [Caerostris extrusa]|uniref:Uncharacterized protein n=1 Tax=Caerostris extrusa TaxID=172846 RepID=A0AAV4WU06_CAEEX|nr:hypothetical protein CEXT_76481 [Caerostris extrusa]
MYLPMSLSPTITLLCRPSDKPQYMSWLIVPIIPEADSERPLKRTEDIGGCAAVWRQLSTTSATANFLRDLRVCLFVQKDLIRCEDNRNQSWVLAWRFGNSYASLPLTLQRIKHWYGTPPLISQSFPHPLKIVDSYIRWIRCRGPESYTLFISRSRKLALTSEDPCTPYPRLKRAGIRALKLSPCTIKLQIRFQDLNFILYPILRTNVTRYFHLLVWILNPRLNGKTSPRGSYRESF